MECSPIDSIRHSLRTLHTGFVAMDATSGHVLAWVGGVDFRFYQFDHVKARRQTGSTFKPLVYATALQQGYSPCEMLSNDSRSAVGSDSGEVTDDVGIGGRPVVVVDLRSGGMRLCCAVRVELLLRA